MCSGDTKISPARWKIQNWSWTVRLWSICKFLFFWTGSWTTVRVISVSSPLSFFFSFLHFLFLFDLAHINLFSWGAHTVCWSTRSVLMGVFDCNRPLYLLYCSNKKKKFFWICHCVLLLVNTEPWHTSHSH